MPLPGPSPALADGVLLSATGLGKRFDGKWIFRGIELELRKGRAVIVTGRNGSGKTTLLKALAGLSTPDEGEVLLAGDDPRRSLGAAALDQSLYPHLSVAEHLETFAQLRGVPPRTEELLDRIGLRAAADRWASRLSTGMKNRLKLGLAIQAKPQVLLLDEPGAALDEAGKELVADICREQKERGGLILATNDPSEKRFGTHELELL